MTATGPRKNVGVLVLGGVLLLVGLGIIGASVQSLVAGPNSAVKCHNEVMSPGDYCQITSNGSTTSKSYTEMKNEKKGIGAPVAGMVLGGIVGALGAYVLWGAYRTRRE
ncbi:MAG: hypothetical protein JO236_16870 [Mycobacterium sp.]|uniref:hypothetical protein n=1 Tax=Mycobacterium sp. TaxID=1785 RepID=UPI001EB4CFC7|nr:hypothetical protein [Mycobacterium sp.]MBW0019202.1 hypothetical protein [Mycobacterium sp.]